MTTLREAAQQALEALEVPSGGQDLNDMALAVSRATVALRAALEQPEQEPVAWMYHGIRFDDTPHDSPSLIWRPEYMDAMSASKGAKAAPLYANPPSREWQSLTEEEINEATFHADERMNTHLEFARALEAALKERNA